MERAGPGSPRGGRNVPVRWGQRDPIRLARAGPHTACPLVALPTGAFTRSAGFVWAGVRLPVSPDVLALRR